MSSVQQQFYNKFIKQINTLYNDLEPLNDGSLADYIPELTNVNPKNFAVSLCTVDGQMFSIGHDQVLAGLQSCVKPILYASAAQQYGTDFVHQYVGKEPSGQRFNALILDDDKRPHNPMVNCGAQIVCSLIKPELSVDERWKNVAKYIERMNGGVPVTFDESVANSERQVAYQNLALAFYMKENECFPVTCPSIEKVMENLEFYFRACATEVSPKSASIIAATLANGGICPTTNERVFDAEIVRNTLILMRTCGMYDYSGRFAFEVNLPAKSGVSGMILLVIPKFGGMCIYSPMVDGRGNSWRGVKFCEELAKKFDFETFEEKS